jgi:anti-anti-sigma factor
MASLHPSIRDEPLAVRVAVDGDAYVIAVSGELDLSSTPKLERALLRAARSSVRSIVVDLSGLRFLDASGLHVLIDAHHACARRGQALQLVRAPAPADSVFELTETVTLFEFLD